MARHTKETVEFHCKNCDIKVQKVVTVVHIEGKSPFPLGVDRCAKCSKLTPTFEILSSSNQESN